MIKIINPDKFIKENKLSGPVTSTQTFQGNSYIFHHKGLFSEDIFGIEGSPERKNSFSWIELNCKIIHPLIFDLLKKRVERKIVPLLSGEQTFDIDENGNFIENEEEVGILNGISSFIENIDKIKFRRTDTEGDFRNKLIDVFEDLIKKNSFFIDKIIVTSPTFRDIFILKETGEVREDKLNDIYRKIITLSYQIQSVEGTLRDIMSYEMQLLVSDLYDYISNRTSKKSGMIRGAMLGKRVDFSARTVIVPDPNMDVGFAGIPLRIICEIFSPFMIYGILNSSYSKDIPEEFHKEVRKFLGKELDKDFSSL